MNILYGLMVPSKAYSIETREFRDSIGSKRVQPKIFKPFEIFPKIIKLMYSISGDVIKYLNRGLYLNSLGNYIPFEGLHFERFQIVQSDLSGNINVIYSTITIEFKLIRQTIKDVEAIHIFQRDDYI